MCFSSKPKINYTTEQANTEKKETAKAKSRLFATEGNNNGQELAAGQGKNVRRIFG